MAYASFGCDSLRNVSHTGEIWCLHMHSGPLGDDSNSWHAEKRKWLVIAARRTLDECLLFVLCCYERDDAAGFDRTGAFYFYEISYFRQGGGCIIEMFSHVWLLMTGSFILLSNYFYWKITKTACLIKKNIFNSLICHRLESFLSVIKRINYLKKSELKAHLALSSFHPQYMYFCHLCYLHSWRDHEISGSSFLCGEKQQQLMFSKGFKGVSINIQINDRNMWSLKPSFRYKQCFVFKNRDFSLQEEATICQLKYSSVRSWCERFVFLDKHSLKIKPYHYI